MFDFLRGITGSAGGSVVGIDIGSSAMRVVQLKQVKGRAVLETYGEIALGPYGGKGVGQSVQLTPEKIAEALRDLIKEANITSASVGVSVPFSASLISVIPMPDVDATQLARMIPIEARKYIPLALSEVTLDWHALPKFDESDAFDRMTPEDTAKKVPSQEVLLVAIQNDTLKKYQEIMRTLGLTTSFYELEIFSTLRATLASGIAPVVVVDIGALYTKVYVIERGIVRATHLSSGGSQRVTEVLANSFNWPFEKAERVKREVGLGDAPHLSREENAQVTEVTLSTLKNSLTDVHRVLLSYGKRYNKNVTKVLLTGAGSSLKGLKEMVAGELQADVVIANPFTHVETPAFLGTVLLEIGPAFSVAIGVALRKLKEQS
jgi:type IV pilus assembly protein PilM